MKHPERAGDILHSYLQRHDITGGEAYVAFYRSWEQIVGQDIASHTNLTEIRNHALCIEVDHPAWMQQVQLRQDRILTAVQRRFPSLEVRALYLRLVEQLGSPAATSATPSTENAGSAATGPIPQTSAAPATAADESLEASGRDSIERIESLALRNSLKRLRSAIAARDRCPGPDEEQHQTRNDESDT